MRRLLLALLVAITAGVAIARDYTATIFWTASDDPTVTGYRVYRYVDGTPETLYDGPDTIFETSISAPTVFSVSAYNDVGESDVVPRIAAVPTAPKPATVEFRVTVSVSEGSPAAVVVE
jgi:hypothetical protein